MPSLRRGPHGWHVVYVTKVVDRSSPALATQTRWISALASDPRVDRVSVLALRVGDHGLPASVAIEQLGPMSWQTAGRLLAAATRLATRGRADFFFVSQGGPFPAILLPLRVLLRRNVYQWKSHPHISSRMRFYIRFCDDLVFASAAASLPTDSPKRRIVGQGIDTELFSRQPVAPSRDVVVVGRVSPIKRVERIVEIVAAATERAGRPISVDVIGPVSSTNQNYLAEVGARARELGVGGQVALRGPLDQEELPGELSASRVMINLSEGAFDKTSAEAMACEVPVLTSNQATLEILPARLRQRVEIDPDDLEGAADRLVALLEGPADELSALGADLRAVIESDHSLRRFFVKILDEIERHRGGA